MLNEPALGRRRRCRKFALNKPDLDRDGAQGYGYVAPKSVGGYGNRPEFRSPKRVGGYGSRGQSVTLPHHTSQISETQVLLEKYLEKKLLL